MSSTPLIPMFSGDGQRVYVTDQTGVPGSIPVENLNSAIQNKYTLGVDPTHYDDLLKSGARMGVRVTSPDGQDGILPSDRVGDAIKNGGFKLGPASQQNLKTTTFGPIQNAALNAAQTILPTDHPVDQALSEAKQLYHHPIDTLTEAFRDANPIRGLMNSAGTEAERSQQAFKSGDVNSGIVHAASSVIPLIGSQLGTAADQIKSGDVSGGVGTSLGVGSQIAAGTPEGEALLTKPIELAKSTARGTGEIVAKGAGKVLGGGEEAMAKRPLPQQTAAGTATNTEVAQYAQQHGINLLPGQATQAPGLKTVQAIAERAVVSPGILPDVIEQQKANFGNLVDDFKRRVGSPDVVDTETAGQNLKAQAQTGLENLKNSAQGDYLAFQQATGDIPVDLSDVKAKYAAKLAAQDEALRNVPAKYATPVRNVLNKLSGIEAGPAADPQVLADFNNAVATYGLNPDQQVALRQRLGLPDAAGGQKVSMSTAQQLRSAYLDIARDYSGNIPKSVQRIAGEAASDIDGAMGKAADQVGATQQWRAANSKWKQLQTTYNSSDSPLYKVLQEPDATKVPSRLLGKGNYGGSPQVIRQLQDANISLAPLKREVAQQIADKNFALSNGGRGMGGFAMPFLQQLFTTEELSELQKMGRVGRAIKFEMNPSGTSNVVEGGHQLRSIARHAGPVAIGGGAGFALGGPVGGVVGATLAGGGDAMMPSLASRMTTSKWLRNATMGDLSAQRPSLSDIVRGGGGAPPPDFPPQSGGSSPQASGPAAPQAPTAPSFLSAKIGNAPKFSTEERIQGSQLRLSELKSAKRSATAEELPDINAAIAREQEMLDRLKNTKGRSTGTPASLQQILKGTSAGPEKLQQLNAADKPKTSKVQ